MPPTPPAYFIRQDRHSAVCFHCRAHQRTDPEGDFYEHHDLQRHSPSGMAYRGRYRLQKDANQPEICPGSGTKPIPLAYRWPDGAKMPRHYW